MDAKVIGKLSIRVVPDSDGFQQEVAATVKKAEQAGPVKIQVEAENKGVVREVREAHKEGQAAADADPIEIPVETDGKSLEDKLKETLARADKLLNGKDGLTAKVGLDRSSLDAALERARKAIGTMNETKFTVDVDDRAFRKSMDRAVNSAEKYIHMDLPAELDAQGFRDNLRRLEKEVRDADATFTVRVDQDAPAMRRVMESVRATHAEVQKLKAAQVDSINRQKAGMRQLEIAELRLKQLSQQKAVSELAVAQATHARKQAIVAVEKATRDEALALQKLDDATVKAARSMKDFHRELEDQATDQYDAHQKKIKQIHDNAIREAETYHRDMNRSVAEYNREQNRLALAAERDARRMHLVGLARAKREAQDAKEKLAERKALVERMVKQFARLGSPLRDVLVASSGFRAMSDLGDFLLDPLKNLDKMVIKFSILTSSIVVLGAAVLALMGNLFSLGRSIAQIVPGALALPGVFVGAAVGAVAFVVALKDFNKRVPEFKKSFGDMKKIIRDNFWAKATGPLRDMGNALLPKVERGMGRVATAAGEFTGALARDLKKALGPDLEGMFGGVEKGLRELTRATPGIAKISATLGRLGEHYLPILSRAIADVTLKFGDWLDKNEKNGNLYDWVDTAIQRIKELWRLMDGIGGVISGIAKAADNAGSTDLGSMADDMQSLDEKINSPEGQNRLTAIFTSARETMKAFFTESKEGFTQLGLAIENVFNNSGPKAGRAMGMLAGAIGKAFGSPAVQQAMDDFFTQVEQSVKDLEPAISGMGDGIAFVIETLTTALKGFTPLFNTVISGSSGILKKIQPDINRIILSMSGGLNDLLTMIMPTIRDIIPSITGGIADVAEALQQLVKDSGPDIQRFLDGFGPAAKAGIETFFDAIKWAVENVLPGLLSILGDIGDLLKWWVESGYGDKIVQFFKDLDAGLKAFDDWAKNTTARDALKQLGDAISEGAAAVGEKTKEIFGALMDWFREKWEEFKTFNTDLWKQVQDKGSEVAQWVKDRWNEAIEAIKQFFTGLGEWFKTQWENLKTGFTEFGTSVKQGFTDVKAKLIEVWGSVRAWFNGVVTGVRDDAVARFESLRSSVKEKSDSAKAAAVAAFTALKDSVVAKAQELVASARAKFDEIKTAVTTAMNNAKAAASTALENLKTTVKSAIDTVVGYFNGLGGRVTGAVGSLWSTLWSAGSDLMGGLRRGIDSGWQSVKTLLSSITSQIPDWKGPENVDKKLLTQNGRWIMDSLIDGFEDGWKEVQAFLQDVTDELGDTTFEVGGAKFSHQLSDMSDVGDPTAGGGSSAGVTVNVTTNNPVAEPTSRTVNKAMQLAALVSV